MPKSNTAQQRVRRRAVLRDYVIAKKSVPCTDCKVSYPSVVMDFDHVRGKKLLNIGRASTTNMSLQRIIDEVLKCEVVCANCHRLRTAAREARRTPEDRELSRILGRLRALDPSYPNPATLG